MTTNENFRKTSAFKWTPKTSKAAILLGKGYTQKEVAEEVGVTDRTLRTWLQHFEFSAEVDRLSVMVDLAGRAERIRLAQRITRQIGEKTNRDLLDWLKFIQSETDGAKLDAGFIDQLATFLTTGGVTAAHVAPDDSDANSGEDVNSGDNAGGDQRADMGADTGQPAEGGV